MLLNHKILGDPEKAPLIILHGLFGMLDNWLTVGRLLSEHYCVYLLDLRNHGRSGWSEDFSYPIMAQDVVEFMDENGIRQAHILGHSMGGKVAMQLALTAGEWVDKLIVADIAPKSYIGLGRGHEQVFEAMFALPVETIKDRQEADAFLTPLLPEWGVRQFVLKNLSLSKETAKYEWRANIRALKAHYQEIMGQPALSPLLKFRGETLFVKGELSDYINPQELDVYRETFPHANIQTLPKAGHWVHADQPQAFYELVKGFLG